jgi:glycosyltransferase involved in cell wall biosynthesis
MRIGITCPYHIFRGGGVQEVVFALHDELSKRGHYVKIITPRPRDYEGEAPESMIFLGTSRDTTAFSGTNWQWSVTVDTSAIDEVFEREQYDVIHFHEPWLPVWGQQLTQRSISANVATLHSYFFDTMTAKTITTMVTPYTKPMIKYFDVITAVSEPATSYFRTLSDRPIAGSGPDEKKLRDYVKELSIPHVTFLGYISDEEKIHQLHKADVFCSPPTTDESFGIVLLEAMAADCPIVCGDNAGYATLMKDTGAVSLVNPRDTIDFARRLELLLFNEDLRKIWIKWARAYVKQYDYTNVVSIYEKAYKEAIKHHDERSEEEA